ncbi:hypothetical protein EWB00_001790, partial [Schistosoma japonicum]
ALSSHPGITPAPDLCWLAARQGAQAIQLAVADSHAAACSPNGSQASQAAAKHRLFG